MEMKRGYFLQLGVLFGILLSVICVASDQQYVPLMTYTDNGQYGYIGKQWDSSEGVSIILPDTSDGRWTSIHEDTAAGILGGVQNVAQGISVTIYSGNVSYEPSLDGIYDYVSSVGYTDVKYVSCNNTIVVQFASEGTSEDNIAFPYNSKVIQVSVLAADKALRSQYAQWIFSATYPVGIGGSTNTGKYLIIAKNSEGIALYSDPDNHNSIVSRVPYLEKVDLTDIKGVYGYTRYNGASGWLNLNYASKINDDGSISLTFHDAYQSVYNYFDQLYDILTVYKYHGYVVQGEETADEYVIEARSYTGARAHYYVNKNTGDVIEQWISPITNEPEPSNYIYTISESDILELRTKKYENMTEDGYYYSNMWTKTNGRINVLGDTLQGCACEYDYSDSYFITYGSANYSNELMFSFTKENILDTAYRAYKIDSTTSFVAISGEEEPKYFSAQDFLQYAEQCKDTGLSFIVHVSAGIATEICISS